jgi:hypothetical protein
MGRIEHSNSKRVEFPAATLIAVCSVLMWALSSVRRAPALHAGGGWSKASRVHQICKSREARLNSTGCKPVAPRGYGGSNPSSCTRKVTMTERYTKAPSHPRGTTDSNMLVSIPFGMMRKDNPLTGLSGYDILKYNFKPKRLAEVPTAAEVKAAVKDAAEDSEDEPAPDKVKDTKKRDEVELRRLLAAIMKAMMTYFSRR